MEHKIRIWPASLRPGGGYAPTLAEFAASDRFRRHNVADGPDDADVLLFLDVNEHPHDPSLRRYREHDLWKQYRHKALIYNELDRPWCAMPGLYVSMPRRGFDWRRQRPVGYLSHHLNPYITARPPAAAGEAGDEPDLLFSFTGRRSHPVRERVLELRHGRGLVQDMTRFDVFGQLTPESERMKRDYAEVMRRSKFVLCPRGAGTSSFRLFETMAAGRVPVMISDQWVAPTGPDWGQFLVQCPEAKVAELPARLEKLEEAWEEMAAEARRAYDEWFGPRAVFHRTAEACRELLEAGACGRGPAYGPRYLRVMGGIFAGRVRRGVKRIVQRVIQRQGGAIESAISSGSS